MSLGIVIKSPEGLVLAAESRITMGVTMNKNTSPVNTHCYFDNATKLMSFSAPNQCVGVVTYGQAVFGGANPRTAASYIPEFESTLPEERLTVEDFAKEVSRFYLKQWNEVRPPMPANTPSMSFVIAGFNENDVLGRIYVVEIPRKPEPEERSIDNKFGITFGGQQDTISRLALGYDVRLPAEVKKELQLSQAQSVKLDSLLKKYNTFVPFQVLALQDCIELANFYIQTTIEAQRLSVGIRGVGGEVDVAIIKRNQPLSFVKRKTEHL
ncbi:MAG: hypothetical protein JW811_08405 [Clostridiales bacterium]|nr:hypothetical protein [Clostridiales bacterium]